MRFGWGRAGRWTKQVGAGLAMLLVAAGAAGASGMPRLGVMGARGMMASASMGVGAAGLPTDGMMSNGAMPNGAMAGAGLRGMGEPYVLHLHHTHTGESLNIVYRIGDTYLPEAMEKLNYFLRDHRTQDLANYDPTEFDLLHTLMARLHRPGGVIDIVCGYRTPESNEFLRTRSSATGVAEHSQHMLSKAIDIQVPGVATATIRNAALEIGAGGVGYYPSSHFVHVDVGPVREWQFGGRPVRMRSVAGHGHGRRHAVRHRRG